MGQQIVVEIHNGEVKIETSGFTGAKCKAETADLERALGRTTADVPTAEMKKVDNHIKAGR